ncbi:LacI family DNA-binding transcriptional regulator [Propionicimonas sp.]|uniref:LacI family DNA-binding transcriptional regulator n=1 Tax=Propionicimonas sp. TaxID=1955623 RepID=UPI0039E2EA3D
MNDVVAGGVSGNRAATLTDVARMAGVSTMTVSRVINGHAKVAAGTRARVREAMEALDYRPNMLARGLASGRSRSIGVLTVDTTLYGPRAALGGIEKAASARDYSVTITHLTQPDRTAVETGVNLLRSRSADGVILLQPLMSEAALFDRSPDLPLVAIHAGVPGQYPLVTVDNRRGAQQATAHLLGLGHRTVWHISGPEDWYESAERVRGWREALAGAGAPEAPQVAGDWSAASGYAAACEVLAHPGVTAIFVANDAMALGALHAMHELGLRCPEDVSLVGFDDDPEAEFFSPGLTTIRQDFDEIGRLSVGLLLDLIETGAPSTQHLVLEPRLVVRGSAAPPSA